MFSVDDKLRQLVVNRGLSPVTCCLQGQSSNTAYPDVLIVDKRHAPVISAYSLKITKSAFESGMVRTHCKQDNQGNQTLLLPTSVGALSARQELRAPTEVGSSRF